MKRVISSSFDWGMDYKPEITIENCDSILNQVKSAIDAKLSSKRYASYSVDFDDVKVEGSSRLVFDVILYKNNQQVQTYEFDFSAYSDYADESDYMSHLNRYIHEFVSYIFKR